MQEINLYDLLKHYAKYWYVIATLTLVGFVSGVVYNNFVQVPEYTSNATLILVSTDPSNAAQDTTTINNYLELMKSRRVLDPVIAKQHLQLSYDQLSNAINTSNDKDTEVMKLAVTTNNSYVSTQAANGIISSFRSQVKALYNLDNIKVVDSASTTSEPSNVHKGLQLALTTIAGFILATIIIFFIYDYRLGHPKSTKKPKAAASINTKPAKASASPRKTPKKSISSKAKPAKIKSKKK